MGLGLGLKKTAVSSMSGGVTLRSLLENSVGFPAGYLPSTRVVEGTLYINTYGKGRDSDNIPVFYKWLFINPTDLSATPDSISEFAKVPETGCIMRIKQRSLLPYHENFVIDYYEDINNISVVGIDADSKQEFQNKKDGIYRTFRDGRKSTPSDLQNEIFSLPEVFFKEYIEPAIPLELIHRGNISESNHISAHGGSFGSAGYKLDINPSYSPSPTPPSFRPSGRPSAAQMQQQINSQIGRQGGSVNNMAKPGKPLDISQTGLRYRAW